MTAELCLSYNCEDEEDRARLCIVVDWWFRYEVLLLLGKVLVVFVECLKSNKSY